MKDLVKNSFTVWEWNFIYNFGESSPFKAGLNAKAGADIKLGPVSSGLSYIMAMNIDNGLYIGTRSGLGQSANRRKAGKRDERILNNIEQKWDSGKDQRIYWIKELCLPKTFSTKQKPRPKS